VSVGQAIVYGIVQGLGEFLPISSSGHLVLLPWLLGWSDSGLSFDVALHIGTLISLLAYFGRDFAVLARAALASIVERRIGNDPKRRLALNIALASVPAAVAGLLLEEAVETRLRSPALVATALILLGLALYLADRLRPLGKDVTELTTWETLLIGIAQACALVPGVSRSGATITAGRALGASRDAAARFSFLLSAPIIFGAGLFKLDDMVRTGVDLPFLVAVATSALVGYVAIRYLLVYVRTRTYGVFVWYRIALGAAVFALLAAEHT
jgi:undecaprenyl-diphosphatase